MESSLRKMENIMEVGTMTGQGTARFFCCRQGKLLVLFQSKLLRTTSLWCVIMQRRKEVVLTGITRVSTAGLLTARMNFKSGSGCSTIMVTDLFTMI